MSRMVVGLVALALLTGCVTETTNERQPAPKSGFDQLPRVMPARLRSGVGTPNSFHAA